MTTSKKPASSSKKKNVTLSRGAAKSLKGNKRDSSVAPKALPQSDKLRSETRVEIKPAKGRPMLTWVGKKPLRHAIAYPAQRVETFNAAPLSKSSSSGFGEGLGVGLLFHGDNKDVLAYLLANGFRGKVKLIYIDPPFDSGADYIRKVELRGGLKASKLESESYTLGEQVQYTDIWANDNYLQFMFERLLMAKELLSEDGSFYLHCDWHKNHFLRCIADEIFASGNFRNEVAWCYGGGGAPLEEYPNKHDTLLWYSKSDDWFFKKQFRPYSEGTLTRGLTAVKGDQYELNEEGAMLNDWWSEKEVQKILSPTAYENLKYPTQKPEGLLRRIILGHSKPGDIVFDFFLGSGTTAAVAQKLGRRWIGADINKGAIQTTIKRSQGVIQEQVENAKGKTQSLPGMEAEETSPPAQLGFAVYRVNDYDLQIQHNEAFNLAVEHLGMTRTKTDAFFDGTLGKKLVKIVPFNHPVTPLDLEEVKKELNNRPDEERDIVVVGLGKEVAVQAWLEEWNKLRKQGNIPNKIEVIELRSDPKYGGFFTHEPAKAKVSFKRDKDKVEITIDDFISPTILERLKQQNKDNPLFQPQVSDWRSMVDSVMIDSNYDGKVFNITLADVPERKNDLVEEKYSVEAKKGATVAVKVTDMLGEEVLVVKLV